MRFGSPLSFHPQPRASGSVLGSASVPLPLATATSASYKLSLRSWLSCAARSPPHTNAHTHSTHRPSLSPRPLRRRSLRCLHFPALTHPQHTHTPTNRRCRSSGHPALPSPSPHPPLTLQQLQLLPLLLSSPSSLSSSPSPTSCCCTSRTSLTSTPPSLLSLSFACDTLAWTLTLLQRLALLSRVPCAVLLGPGICKPLASLCRLLASSSSPPPPPPPPSSTSPPPLSPPCAPSPSPQWNGTECRGRPRLVLLLGQNSTVRSLRTTSSAGVTSPTPSLALCPHLTPVRLPLFEHTVFQPEFDAAEFLSPRPAPPLPAHPPPGLP